MDNELSLDALWNAPLAPTSTADLFHDGLVTALPPTAQCYLTHAIAPGTPLATAVRLTMHGEIKLKGWLPFTAEQVIRWDRGMIWSATAYNHGLPIRGFDRLIDGVGSMRWKLLGILPVMSASGSDNTRSAIGRVQAESIWLPSALCRTKVDWSEHDRAHPQASFAMFGETTNLDLTIDESGRVRAAALKRWGNPDNTTFRYVDFGGSFASERRFDGYTIPTEVRVGWYFGTPHFEAGGEFFRATVDHATFR